MQMQLVIKNNSEIQMVDNYTDVVLLVHGIRDLGRWTGVASEIFENAGLKSAPVKYGYYDVLSFLAPYDASDTPYQKLVALYESTLRNVPNPRISIIAHSFGTFLVGRLLNEFHCRGIHRVVLCGSVLPQDFDWDNVLTRFSSLKNFCLNECGTSDIWPLMADSARKRYGAAGRHGFENTVLVANRWYLGGHGTFFTRQHIAHWVEFIRDGKLPEPNGIQPNPLFTEKIFATIPLISLIWSGSVTIAWMAIMFWYGLVILAGLLYLWSVWSPNYLKVEIQHLLDEATTNASTLDDKKWELFKSENFLRVYSRDVEFDAVVAKVDPKTADGNFYISLYAPNCDKIRQQEPFIVRITIHETAINTELSVLMPLELENSDRFAKVHVKGRFEQLTRDGKRGGKIFMRGDSLVFSNEYQDCRKSNE